MKHQENQGLTNRLLKSGTMEIGLFVHTIRTKNNELRQGAFGSAITVVGDKAEGTLPFAPSSYT